MGHLSAFQNPDNLAPVSVMWGFEDCELQIGSGQGERFTAIDINQNSRMIGGICG
jgi:hypothetical protein